MFKQNIFKILAIVFFLLSATTFYNSNKVIPKKIIENKKVYKKIISPTTVLSPTNYALQTTTYQLQPTAYLISPITISENPTPTATNYPLPTTTSLAVSLSIFGSSVGSFDIPQGSDQCDVLTQALSQGKIQSLNMRYNSDYGTNAVYQINGIGKENAVWWGFKVNGQSPSQGCSYIKVNNNDNVEWTYVGN